MARRLMVIAIMVVAMSGGGYGQTSQAAEAPRAGQCYVLLVGGLPGTAIYGRRFEDWLKRFHAYFAGRGVAEGNMVVLSGDKNFKEKMVAGAATRDSILENIGKLSERILPQDQFVLVMVGHGSLSDAQAGFVLAGPDLDGAALGKALAGIKAENQVVLNFSGVGGDFLKSLAKKGRVNIAATLADENAEPVLAEFFLRGLESGRAGAGGDVTLLQAYNWATHQTAMWICRQVAEKDGTWSVQGKESVEIFKKLFDGPDGALSAVAGMRADGSRKLSEDSDASKPDADVPLVVPAGIRPSTSSPWEGRRLINEHSQVEDCGQKGGVSALGGETGYAPVVAGKEGEEGFLAGRVVLGKAALLPAGGK